VGYVKVVVVWRRKKIKALSCRTFISTETEDTKPEAAIEAARKNNKAPRL